MRTQLPVTNHLQGNITQTSRITHQFHARTLRYLRRLPKVALELNLSLTELGQYIR